jgi:hypothetical protein
MSKIYNLIKNIPFFIMLVLLSIIYLACGYIAGYYYGYNQGQQDYFKFIENLNP